MLEKKDFLLKHEFPDFFHQKISENGHILFDFSNSFDQKKSWNLWNFVVARFSVFTFVFHVWFFFLIFVWAATYQQHIKPFKSTLSFYSSKYMVVLRCVIYGPETGLWWHHKKFKWHHQSISFVFDILWKVSSSHYVSNLKY